MMIMSNRVESETVQGKGIRLPGRNYHGAANTADAFPHQTQTVGGVVEAEKLCQNALLINVKPASGA
jgi:hypothetical protein